MYHIGMNEGTYGVELGYDEPMEIEPQGLRAILATPGGRLAWRLGFASVEMEDDPWPKWRTQPRKHGATFTHRDYCLERAEVVRDYAPQVSVLGGLYANLGLLGTHRTPPPFLEPLLEGALRDGVENGILESHKHPKKRRWIWPLGSDLFVDVYHRVKVWIVPFEYSNHKRWTDEAFPYIGVKPYSTELTRALQMIMIQQEIASRIPVQPSWLPVDVRFWGGCFATPEELVYSGFAFAWETPTFMMEMSEFEHYMHIEGRSERRPTRPITKIIRIHELLEAMTQATGLDHD